LSGLYLAGLPGGPAVSFENKIWGNCLKIWSQIDSWSNNTIGKGDQANYLHLEMNHVYNYLSKGFVQSYSKFQQIY